MGEKIAVGSLFENHLRQFAKVISAKNGVYGLSDWMTRANAEKATVATRHINVYGLESSGAKIVKSVKAPQAPSATSAPSDEAGNPPAETEEETKPKAKKNKPKAKK